MLIYVLNRYYNKIINLGKNLHNYNYNYTLLLRYNYENKNHGLPIMSKNKFFYRYFFATLQRSQLHSFSFQPPLTSVGR